MHRQAIGALALILAIAAVVAGLWWGEQAAGPAESLSLVPLFSHPPGEYSEDIWLEMKSAHPDGELYYTLDGRIPDPANDIVYSEAIQLTADEPKAVVVRAVALLPDGTQGPVNSVTYFMGMETGLPKLSIIVDPDDLWDEAGGIYVNYSERGREWERPVDVTYVSAEGDTAFHLGAGLRIHGELTRWFSDKKSLRLYFRRDYGPPKLEYPIFGQEGQTEFDMLILHNSMKDLLLFRNQLAERLSAQIGGFSSRSEPTLLFINGEPWGIYHIREPIDQRFLEENYGIESADLSDTPNIASRQSAEQRRVDLVHWENFMAFVDANDLSDPANYEYIKTQIDLDNFVDYYLLEMFIGNTDWPHHNVHQFRPRTPGGKWEWIVWDSDRAFDRADRQMVEHVLVATHRYGERMETLLNKLLANPEFRNLFITRAADLFNTHLSTASVQAQIDDITAQIEGDIEIEQNRWDISREWEDTVSHISNFALERPDNMRQHFVESLGLEGTALINFNSRSEPPGWVVVNQSEPDQLPWTGTYFSGSDITLQAIPPYGYEFAGWEGVPDLEAGAGDKIVLNVEDDITITPRFEALDPRIPQAGDVTFLSVHVDDGGEIKGDWFELQVNKEGGIDLRGWRVTDNDSLQAIDEGSLIFTNDSLLEKVVEGTVIRVIVTENSENAARFAEDGTEDGVLTLYAGNGRLDTETDPWFNLGPRDNLLLLAPGPTSDWGDDTVIDLWSENGAVKRSTFALPPLPNEN